MTPRNRGTPAFPSAQSTPSNLLGTDSANLRDSACWPAARMLTAKWLAFRKAERFCELRARHHSTSGGFKETEVKELTVTPAGVPSLARVVTTATPVANCPSTRRNSFSSNAFVLPVVIWFFAQILSHGLAGMNASRKRSLEMLHGHVLSTEPPLPANTPGGLRRADVSDLILARFILIGAARKRNQRRENGENGMIPVSGASILCRIDAALFRHCEAGH